MRVLVALIVSLAMFFAGAAIADAGEYSGKGKPVPGGENGRSECSFSGRDISDDVEMNPPGLDDDGLFIRGVQSYGQIVSLVGKDGFPTPGQACRGNLGGD